MRRRMPSPAMLVALLALAVALGGTGYAAVKLKRNSVGAKQIKPNAVQESELAAAAVGAAEIAADAVGAGEIATGAVGSDELADGSLTRGDAAPGVLVTAFARVNQPEMAEATIASGTAVNVIDVDDAGGGQAIVSFNPAALPGGSIATCTVTATAITVLPGLFDPAQGTATIDPIDPGTLSANSIEVQTHGPGSAIAEKDFFVQASCPPG